MGGDEIRNPPRWADALLRIFLDPREAETASGDLIEAYRDAIFPERGRWSADIWFVWQVFSYVRRARGTPLRNWLLASLALCVLTIIFSVLMYPGLLATPAAVLITAGFICYAYVVASRTRSVTTEDTVVLRLGKRYGIAIGAMWVVGFIAISTGIHGVRFLLPIIAFAVPFVAGAHAAVKLWRIGAGMRVGFWGGLISGLIVFFWMMTVGYADAFIPGLPGAEIPSDHFHTAVEYQRANVGVTLGGGLSYLFLFGGVLSVIGGTVGGAVGIAISSRDRGLDEPSHFLWNSDGPYPAHSEGRTSNVRRWILIRAELLAYFVAAVLVIAVLVNVLSPAVSPPPAPADASTSAQPPQTAADYLARGDEFFDRRDYKGALAHYSRAIELDPNFAGAYNNRAYAYMMMENYAAALPDLDAAIRLRPNYVNALMKRGDIHNSYYQIDRKLAIADYDRIIAQGPAVYSHTQVCGHRLVAQHNGMSAGLWFSIVLSGQIGQCRPYQ